MKQLKALGKTLASSQTTRVKVQIEATIDIPLSCIGESTSEEFNTAAGCYALEELPFDLKNHGKVVDLRVDGEVIGDVDAIS